MPSWSQEFSPKEFLVKSRSEIRNSYELLTSLIQHKPWPSDQFLACEVLKAEVRKKELSDGSVKHLRVGNIKLMDVWGDSQKEFNVPFEWEGAFQDASPDSDQDIDLMNLQGGPAIVLDDPLFEHRNFFAQFENGKIIIENMRDFRSLLNSWAFKVGEAKAVIDSKHSLFRRAFDNHDDKIKREIMAMTSHSNPIVRSLAFLCAVEKGFMTKTHLEIDFDRKQSVDELSLKVFILLNAGPELTEACFSRINENTTKPFAIAAYTRFWTRSIAEKKECRSAYANDPTESLALQHAAELVLMNRVYEFKDEGLSDVVKVIANFMSESKINPRFNQ